MPNRVEREEPILFDEEESERPANYHVKLTSAEQVSRNHQIVRAKMRGLPYSMIADTYGLSIRQCKRVMKEFRATNPTLRHQDPLSIVDHLLEGYQGALEELAVIASTTGNDNARVGAINSRMQAMTRIAELLQAINVLPNDLGTLRVHLDAQLTSERLLEVIDRFDLSDEVVDAMIEALDAQAGIKSRPALAAAVTIEPDPD